MSLMRAANSLLCRATGFRLVRQGAVGTAAPTADSPFFGDYPSFEAASAECGLGYDDPAISAAVIANRQKSIDAAISHIDERFISPLAAMSVAIDRLGKKSVSVLDFGGGNGCFADIVRHYLPNISFDWTVVETPSMVESCSQVSSIRWLTDIPEERFDFVLLCGVLQCIPDPLEKLARAASTAQWIVIQRVFLAARDRITRYVPAPSLQSGCYPIRFFGEKDFISEIEKIGTIEMKWTVEVERHSYPFDSLPIGLLIYCGPKH